MKNNTFYITTPIYYVNAKPHLGTLYSTVLADVAARWQRLRGKAVFFLTGTDEHGQKVADSAHKAHMAPQQFVDSLVPAFTDLWERYHVSYDKFIRTTDAHHVQTVQAWLSEMLAKDEIYLGAYEGWYCTGCEAFAGTQSLHPLSSVSAAGCAGQVTEQVTPPCPTCGRETQMISEPAYFFRLSKYQNKLLAFFKEHPDFVTPRERLAEVVSFVEGGLKDLCVSRTTLNWGIPFPNDSAHVTYVWADALLNYVSAIGYQHPTEQQTFNRWWNVDSATHVMGKDIVRFHAVYWSAFLMASGLALPKTLLVHGWIKVGDQKMSKSLGNAIDPVALSTSYGSDQVRYYLTRYLAITHDSPFAIADLEQRLNADLAHDLGNLLNRIVMLADRYDCLELQAPAVWDDGAHKLQALVCDTIRSCSNDMENYQFHRAYNTVWSAVHGINAYVHSEEPWKLFKSNPERAKMVLSAACHALQAVAVLVLPVMPNKMQELLHALGVEAAPAEGIDHVTKLRDTEWNSSYRLAPGPVLFTKIEVKPVEVPVAVTPEQKYITIDTFGSVELLVGTITNAETIEKSNKLYKLSVDLGSAGVRTILAGVRAYFAPEELVGKQGTFVANLAPRPMLGEVSQGMMIVAETAEGKRVLVAPTSTVPNGTRLG